MSLVHLRTANIVHYRRCPQDVPVLFSLVTLRFARQSVEELFS
jgi:hypothetical protein